MQVSEAGFLYFVPVATFLIAWFALGEQPQPLDIAGGVFILIGVGLVRLKNVGKVESAN